MPDREMKFSFEVDQKKIQTARKSIADLAAQAKALDLQLKGLAKTAGSTGPAVGNSLKAISQNQVQLTNEVLKGTKAWAAQESVLQKYRRALADTQSAAKMGAIGGSTGGVGRVLGVVGGAANLAGLDTAIPQLGNIARQATPLLQGLGASTAQVAVAAPIAGITLIALSLAAQKFAEDMEANKKRVDNSIASQKTYYELLATGTSESIKAGLEEAKVKLLVAQAVRRDIQAGQDQLKQFGIFQGLAEQFTGLKDQAKAADDEINQTQAQIDVFTRALGTNQVAANDAKAAEEALAKSRDDLTAKLQQNRDEQNRIREQSAEQEASILLRLADQRIALAKRLAEQEEAAYTNLQHSLAEGRLRLTESQTNTRLDYQREEARSARQHYRNLLQIKKDAEFDEFNLALNRDFAGLAALRRNTDKKLSEEEDRYQTERKERLIALKHQLADQQKAWVREREQRVKQYQQQLTDLRAQQVREVKAADEAAQIDLRRLHERLIRELALRQDAYSAILQLEANYVARMRAIHGQSSGDTGPINTTKLHEQKRAGLGGFASGGYPPVGRPSLVNERRGQRESVSAGGKSVMLPGGMGLFTPLRSTRVNPGGGGNISFGDIVVQGASPAEIRRNVHRIVDAKLTEAFEAITA